MTNKSTTSEEDTGRQKTIDEAILDCRRNISRHTFAPLFELVGALTLLAVVAFTVLELARIQNQENDARRLDLLSNLKESSGFAREADKSRIYAEEALSSLEKEFAKSPKTKDDAKLKSAAETVQAAQKRRDAARERLASASKELSAYRGKPVVSDNMLYGVAAILVLVIAIVSSIYRFHLREIAKNEQYKLAFLRIRIAANNAGTPGFEGEVRTALTRNPFDIQVEDASLFRRRNVESPIPGHPSSDLATSVINRLLDDVEFIVQPKGKGGKASS